MKKPPPELVEDFFSWFNDDQHTIREDFYSDKINYSYLSKLSKQDFIDFFFEFAHEGGKVQSGGYRTANSLKTTIESKFDEFREFALAPFGETFDDNSWLGQIAEFPFLGKGIATIYLNRVDKKRFAIVNNKAVKAVQLFDIKVPSKLIEQYKIIRDAEKQIIEWYPEFENLYRADALTHFLIGEDAGRKWKDYLFGSSDDGFSGRYWIYAPGEQARKWSEYFNDGLMGIGWKELSFDLTGYNKDDLRSAYDDAFKEKATDIDFKQLADFVLEVRKGDRVFVKKGTTKILGFGEIDSDYFYDPSRDEYRHLRKVKWVKSGEWSIPEKGKKLPVKTMTELHDKYRAKQYYDLIETGFEPAIPELAFQLLEKLHENPTASFYKENVDAFRKNLEQPFKELMKLVAQKLPEPISATLETKKGTISKIQKNDYGKGGAWDHYWGAFYPKGGKRIKDAQLFVGMNSTRLDFGFYIGDYGIDQRSRFVSNCVSNKNVLLNLLKNSLSQKGITFGERSDDTNESSGLLSPELNWDEWLNQFESAGIRAGMMLTKDEVLSISSDDLADKIAKLFINLYPLYCLATQSDPIPKIRQFLNIDSPIPEELNPEYPLSKCSDDTFIDLEQLEKWVRAIERKQQAIFYGPPGTGKTFIAEKLAKHLIGGGYGIKEIVQFHPSYSYEDFMQGLRPKTLTDGGLEYAMVPGRFKDFCKRAKDCGGICVLVIDEINRANLSKVLGELMFLLEYRSQSIPLAGGESFQIPDNVRIIGTMNTADRSIALVDHALRRRFAFLSLYPDFEILRKYHEGNSFKPNGLIGVLERLNGAINDKHYSLGISYFLDQDINNQIKDIWQMEIEPYIEELFFDQPQKADSFSWKNIKSEIFK